MNENHSREKIVQIVYYSGTGGTERVAQSFKKSFGEAGYEVCMQHLAASAEKVGTKHDLLLVVYAVHACNAPESIYKWIENSERVRNVPAVVISVSGGGEIIPNTACRLSCINRLEKKGYKVMYERMLVMPSNWIVPTKTPLALRLLEVLPNKVHKIVSDISNDVIRRTKPLLIDRFFSYIGEIEKLGAGSFGKRIIVSEACSGCGWCEKNCPAGNITMNTSKPLFGGACHTCLGCIYGCPNKALEPGTWRFIVIKEGYNLTELEKQLACSEQVDVEKLATGYLWSGVKKYLLDDDE